MDVIDYLVKKSLILTLYYRHGPADSDHESNWSSWIRVRTETGQSRGRSNYLMCMSTNVYLRLESTVSWLRDNVLIFGLFLVALPVVGLQV